MKENKLHKKQTSGFKTPKDYFSKVEEQILNEVSLKNKVVDAGFKVPDSYFETLEDNITNKLDQNRDGSKVISLFNRKSVVYISTIAASLLLLFNVFYNTPNTLSFDSLETASIENYLEDEDFSSFELSELLTTEELNTTNITDTQIPEDTLEDYLLENSDIEDLIIH